MDSLRFFNVNRIGDNIVAEVIDSQIIGATQAEIVKLELRKILEDSPKSLVIDFQNVSIIGSNAIDSLLYVVRRTASGKTRVKLSSMSSSLRTLFKSLNLDGTVFEIYDSVDEALERGDTSYYDASEKLSPPEEEGEADRYEQDG